MTFTSVLIVLLILDAALLIFAVRRPWIALVALLAGLPFNGFLLDVVAPALNIAPAGSLNRLALAGWHDALAVGIVLASVWAVYRIRRLPRRTLEWLGVAVLAWGLVELVLAPGILAAVYSYRILYLPVALMLAVVVLAMTQGIPQWAPARAAGAIVGSGIIAAAFALWQVYVGGYGYLNTYYQASTGLPAAYSSALVDQPRAIGTLHSPNEFGAYLVIAAAVALTPGILPLGRFRPWVGALLGIALLLTFSRSAWVAAIVSGLLVLLMTGWRPRLAGIRRSLARNAVPLVVFFAATGLILTTSNGIAFIHATLTGSEPSAAVHIGAIDRVLTGGDKTPGPSPGSRPPSPGAEAEAQVGEAEAQVGERIVLTPLGGGLGTAGPKSARFTDAEPIRHSEIWYLNYVAQVGLLGLALAGAFVGSMLLELWRQRWRPWPAVAMAVLVALGAGAIFIPVIDEPPVAGALWAILGLAIIHVRGDRGRTETPQQRHARSSGA